VWGVFPGGRAHCAARGLAGEEERSGRQGSVGGSRVVARALRNLPPARCLGSRAYGHRPRRRILDLRGGSAGEVRADVMRRACPTSRHSRLIHVSQLQVWMSSSPLQPWSLLLIRDSGAPPAKASLPSVDNCIHAESRPTEWWQIARSSPAYGSGGWGFESLAARHHHRSSAAL
jgi:hypothetical protein